MNSDKFSKFDHGREENLKRYSAINPPEYNLSNVRTNIHLMHGTNDLFAMNKVRKTFIEKKNAIIMLVHMYIYFQNFPLLIKKLENAKIYDRTFIGFNHFDFPGPLTAKVQDVILKLEKALLK